MLSGDVVTTPCPACGRFARVFRVGGCFIFVHGRTRHFAERMPAAAVVIPEAERCRAGCAEWRAVGHTYCRRCVDYHAAYRARKKA